MEIRGLADKLGVTDDQLNHLRKLKVESEARIAQLYMSIWRRGGNLHGTNEKATAKRRKANKVARAQRKKNR